MMPSQFEPRLLNTRREHAVRVSAALVSRRGDTLKTVLQAALESAFSPPELVELILQSLLFDGYPCALEGLLTLKELLGTEYQPESLREAYTSTAVDRWRSRGEEMCQRIYGSNFDPLLRNVESLSPSLKEWMLMEGYGRVLSRATLPLDLRELAIIAILTVKDLPRQLHSHLRGALRVGLSAVELESALCLCAEYTTADRLKSALEVLRKLNPRLIQI
jgi:4-carboxymuconolactone decarboxylase